MKIKLILAAAATDPLRRNDPFMPLSLAILAGVAPDHDYVFVDLLWEDDVNFDEAVDLVGISFRYTAENTAYQIADEFRRRGVPVVMGGAQPSMVPHRALEHADAVAIGEAEELWPVIVADAERKRLRQFYVCGPRPFDARGCSLYQVRRYPNFQTPLNPDRRPFKKKYVFDTVFAARGCPMNCDFCSVTEISGPRYRLRPVDEVLREIDCFKNYYYILDDTVFGRPETYDYYQSLYDGIAGLKRRRYWTGQANLDAAADPRGRSVITAAARAGLLYAAVGMESVNPETLVRSGTIRKMGVGSPHEAIARMKDHIRFIQDQGIIVSGWFVIGYEDDAIDTYDRTADFCREMNIVPVIFPVKVLPGTRLHRRLSRKKMLDDSLQLNFLNPSIPPEAVYPALKRVADAGYCWREIAKRTRFYWARFSNDRIHRTIFTLVLQMKLRGAIDTSRDEFYVAPGAAD